jgi:hypothetical protein
MVAMAAHLPSDELASLSDEEYFDLIVRCIEAAMTGSAEPVPLRRPPTDESQPPAAR